MSDDRLDIVTRLELATADDVDPSLLADAALEIVKLRAARDGTWYALSDVVLKPIIAAAGVDIEGPDGRKRVFQLVDDVIARLEGLRAENAELRRRVTE